VRFAFREPTLSVAAFSSAAKIDEEDGAALVSYEELAAAVSVRAKTTSTLDEETAAAASFRAFTARGALLFRIATAPEVVRATAKVRGGTALLARRLLDRSDASPEVAAAVAATSAAATTADAARAALEKLVGVAPVLLTLQGAPVYVVSPPSRQQEHGGIEKQLQVRLESAQSRIYMCLCVSLIVREPSDVAVDAARAANANKLDEEVAAASAESGDGQGDE